MKLCAIFYSSSLIMADGNIDSKQKSKGRARRRQTNAEKTSENPDELMDEAGK